MVSSSRPREECKNSTNVFATVNSNSWDWHRCVWLRLLASRRSRKARNPAEPKLGPLWTRVLLRSLQQFQMVSYIPQLGGIMQNLWTVATGNRSPKSSPNLRRPYGRLLSKDQLAQGGTEREQDPVENLSHRHSLAQCWPCMLPHTTEVCVCVWLQLLLLCTICCLA